MRINSKSYAFSIGTISAGVQVLHLVAIPARVGAHPVDGRTRHGTQLEIPILGKDDDATVVGDEGIDAVASSGAIRKCRV
jgi:hypothetical protein